MTTIKETETAFFNYVKRIQNYEEALNLINWDMRTGAPKNGVEQRSEVVGSLSETVYNMKTSEEMKNYLEALEEDSEQKSLSLVTQKSVAECRKEYDENVKIPPQEYKEFVMLQSKAETIWEDAKAKSDFSQLQPYLEKLVEFNRRFADYWGYEDTPYNALLDQFEPGVTVNDIDKVFGELRDGIIPLVKEIENSEQPRSDYLLKHFPKENQRAFSEHILKEIGYDFQSGRLDETAHPFATALNPGDVRVTTRFNEDDFRLAVFGTIHEGGHALYEQHIDSDLVGTPLCSGTSMGIHESQSLFFENFIGRNKGFWNKHYASLKQYAPGQFDDISLDEYYRGINMAGPSFIRIEADELTYPLHIILRYELEKGLFNKEIEVKDLPGLWNEKMNNYLGIVPKSDREGVLQDVHWSGGAFGYFPSYALGYIYAAQFKNAMLKDVPNFDELLGKGDVTPIREWLTKHVHRFGKMKKPKEILHDTTGEGMNAAHLLSYLTNKYKGIYQF